MKSFLHRIATEDSESAEAIIQRLEGSGVPFEKILERIRQRAKEAEERLKEKGWGK